MKRNLLVILAASIDMAVLPTAEATERIVLDTVGVAEAAERLCVERWAVEVVTLERALPEGLETSPRCLERREDVRR